MVYLSFAPSAGGTKLSADLTARQCITAKCLCQVFSGELYNKLINAMPAAELKYVQV